MSAKYSIYVNPFNHSTFIGKIDANPQFFPSHNSRSNKNILFKVHVQAPRDYPNHDQVTGKEDWKTDGIKGSSYVSLKQAKFYKAKFTKGTWVVLRGATYTVSYTNKDGKKFVMHLFNIDDINQYEVPHTDTYMLSPHDRQCIVSSIKGVNWLLRHSGLVRKFAPNAYQWLMAHDAFVPTRVHDFNKRKQTNSTH